MGNGSALKGHQQVVGNATGKVGTHRKRSSVIDYCCLLRLWMASRRQVWYIPAWSRLEYRPHQLTKTPGFAQYDPSFGAGLCSPAPGLSSSLSCRVLLQATHVPTSVCVSACLCVWGAGFAGTPGYLSPEVLRKDPYGKPVDLWACGESIQRPDCHRTQSSLSTSPHSPVSPSFPAPLPRGHPVHLAGWVPPILG